MYSTLKAIHVSAVVVSGAGFALRFALSVKDGWTARGWRRIAPHAVDTVLLGSAVALLWVGGFRPFEVGWLEAKIIGLVLYILVGSIALKHGLPARWRVVPFVAALLLYGYIVTVAVTKNPLGPLDGGMG